MAAHSSDQAVTSDSRMGLWSADASRKARSDQSRQRMVSGKGQIIMVRSDCVAVRVRPRVVCLVRWHHHHRRGRQSCLRRRPSAVLSRLLCRRRTAGPQPVCDGAARSPSLRLCRQVRGRRPDPRRHALPGIRAACALAGPDRAHRGRRTGAALLGSARRNPRCMTHTITLIPGDGIGPEVTAAVTTILDAAGLDITWERYDAGVLALATYGTPLPEELLASIRKNRVALKGPVTTPVGEGFTSVNVGLRKALNLYANLRPVKNLPHVRSRFEHVDLVIVRENTEDLYSGIEHEVVPGVVESLKIITEAASTRIARFAFDYARAHGRRRVTAVHKANIMKMGDGLFLKSVQDVAAGYPEITQDDRIVDAACMHLVMKPEQFDVLLLPNLYGDI